MKNQRRFNFGGVYPPEHAAAHPDDPDRMQTEVLLEADESATLEVRVRFLHIVQRGVEDATGRRVDALSVDAEQYLSWEEAIERELDVPLLRIGGPGPISTSRSLRATNARRSPTPPAAPPGALTRQWDRLDALVSVSVHPVRQRFWRVAVEIRNRTSFDAAQSRQRALERTLCSTHTLLHIDGGAFVSLTDPPAALAAAAEGCRNARQLAGARRRDARTGARFSPRRSSSRTIRASRRRVRATCSTAARSIRCSCCNILALSDEEKAEMRASDPRAREILERTEALTPEQLMALHGTIREFGMTR